MGGEIQKVVVCSLLCGCAVHRGGVIVIPFFVVNCSNFIAITTPKSIPSWSNGPVGCKDPTGLAARKREKWRLLGCSASA